MIFITLLKIPPLLLIVLVGLVPLTLFASLLIVPQNIKWQPPVIWKDEFTGSGIVAVAADKTGIYALGNVWGNRMGPTFNATSHAFLKKFDLSGGEVWTEQLGDPLNVTLTNISVGTDGLYISGVNDTGLGSQKTWAFVEKHDMNGNKIWTNKLEYVSIPSLLGISASSSGLYVADLAADNAPPIPLTMRHYDLDGGTLWTKTLTNATGWVQGASLLVYADQNGPYLAGWGFPSISRFDTNGNIVWTRQVDSSGFKCDCHPFGLAGDGSGIYIGGSDSLSSTYSFLRKYDLNGNVLWSSSGPVSTVDEISANQLSVYTVERAGVIARYDGGNGNRLWSFATIGGATAGQNGVYVATGSELVNYSESASLVLFGINPPYSFIMISTIPGVIILTVLLKRRSWTRQAQRNARTPHYDPNQAKN